MTRRMSAALGSNVADVSVPVISVPAILAPLHEPRRALAKLRARSQRGQRGVPRQQDRTVARWIVACGIEQDDSLPVGCRTLAGQPKCQLVSGRGELVGGTAWRGGGEYLCGCLPDRAGLRPATDPGNAALFIERKPHTQRAATTARAGLALERQGGLERKVGQPDRGGEDFGRVEHLTRFGAMLGARLRPRCLRGFRQHSWPFPPGSLRDAARRPFRPARRWRR